MLGGIKFVPRGTKTKTTKTNQMKKLIVPVLVGLLAITGLNISAGEPAVNPTGTWKVTYTLDGKTQTYEPTLKLKQEGDKLTGTFTRSHNEQDIEMALEDVKLEASEISFTVSISGNGGAKMVRKFHGKIAGDTIKEGTVREIWNGEDRTSDHPFHWEAKRVKE
jgi:preprotein translocase subunit SecD